MRYLRLLSLAPLAGLFAFCSSLEDPGLVVDPGYYLLGPNRISIYPNDPGTTRDNGTDKQIDVRLAKLIDAAEKSVDMAVYNLSRETIIEAMVRAEERGIDVRMVGDVDEVVTDGYRAILSTNIPFSLGNTSAIQHNKFAVIDEEIVVMGTGNITTSGFIRNNNHFAFIESDSLAKSYTDEFEQMFFGKFGSKKIPNDNAVRSHRVNFVDMEIYYSPYDGQNAMDRLIEIVDGATDEVQYMIFAHTHDEFAAAMIRAARRGVTVRGVHDDTFITGTSEEAPRMYSASQYLPNLSVRGDGNEHTATPELKSHGGKLHTKTVIVDGHYVGTGSFNWSTNATDNNDENMLLIDDPFVTAQVQEQWEKIWSISRPMCCAPELRMGKAYGDQASKGEVVISEINWAGSWGNSETFVESDDDWIELYNTTGRDIDLSHWTITWETNEQTVYPIPDRYNWFKANVASRHYFNGGLVLPAGRFFILNGQNGSLDNTDNKISGTKDFGLTTGQLHIRLYDAAGNLIDEAGNGDPPFSGKLDSFNKLTFSMERLFHPATGVALDGRFAGSWYTTNGNDLTGSNLRGTGQINENYDERSIATPYYSGNGVTLASTRSSPRNGYNNYTNIPMSAESTGSGSAQIQMRWAMLSVPSVTISPDICGGACPVSLDGDDPSKIKVSTGAQTAGQTYTLTVNNDGTDMTNNTAEGGPISFTGNRSRAIMQIVRVYPAQSSSEDVILLQAITSGTVNDLGIYMYDSFSVTPSLIYRMTDVSVSAGQFIEVTMDKSCDLPCGVSSVTPEDRRLTNTPSFDITANPANSVLGASSNSSVWQVFSPTNLPSTDAIVFISYDTASEPEDLMCYSNLDGTMSETLMKGGQRQVSRWSANVWNLNFFPVDEVNDFRVQSKCVDFDGGTSGDYLRRNGNTDTNSNSDWVCVGC